MIYAPLIELVSGDTAPDVLFTLYDDAADAPVDLTLIPGAEVHMRFQPIGQPSAAVDVALDVVTAAEGRAKIQWGAVLLTVEPGAYEGEVRIEGTGGFRRTIGTRLRFSIRAPGAPL